MKNKYYFLRLAWVKSMRIGAQLGCHQIPKRSFHFRQYQFPVCARCCGVLIGEISAIIMLLLGLNTPIFIDIIFMAIMFIDWGVQFINLFESNNIRRLITGILGGYGCWSLFFKFIITIFHALI